MQSQSADAVPFASVVFAANPHLSRVALEEKFRATVKSSLNKINNITGLIQDSVFFDNDLSVDCADDRLRT